MPETEATKLLRLNWQEAEDAVRALDRFIADREVSLPALVKLSKLRSAALEAWFVYEQAIQRDFYVSRFGPVANRA